MRIPGKSHYRLFGSCLLIVTAILVSYFDGLRGPFVFDDIESVVNNVSIWKLTDFGWLHPPSEGPLGGRPLANGTFALSYTFSGLDVFGFHLFNVLLHAANALMLFALLRRIFAHPHFREIFRNAALPLALACTLIWAVHPLCTGAVTYISQRTEELMAFFYLAVVLISWKTTEKPFPMASTIAATVACFIGVACKEEMATAPLMVLFIDWSLQRKTFKAVLGERPFLYLGLFSSWILLAFFWAGAKERGVGSIYGVHWYQYALTESRVVIKYIEIIIFPRTLVLDYELSPYRPYVEEIPYAVLLGGMVLLTAYLCWKRNVIGLALGWFLLLLAPSSSVIPVALQPMGENRIYIASVGVIALTICFGYSLLRKWSWPILSVVACCCAYGTIQRNDDYASFIKIWADTVKKVPTSSRAHNNLGLAFYSEGRLDEADREFDQSIRLKGNWADPVHNKGRVALQRGRHIEAMHWYQRALQIDPEGKSELADLCQLLVQNGDLETAQQMLNKSITLYPQYGLNWDTLGMLMLSQNHLSESISAYQKAVALAPTNAAYHNNLGGALLKAGKDAEAGQEFSTAVELKPNLAKAQTNLATILARSGEYDLAITHYLYGLQNDPADTEARVNLGLAYQQIGQTHAAAACFREALRRNPKDPRAPILLKAIADRS